MSPDTSRPALRTAEFIPLIALLISLDALSTDAMLPALSAIARELGAARANDAQFVITSLFLGLGIGQMLFGPLSDRIGRKTAIYGGLALFMTGCLVSVLASTFETMIAGRVLQGIGVAAPHVVSMALVRDQYEGRLMARLMSLALAVFILVPTVAPALGQLIMWLVGWRAIFVTFLAISAVALIWLALRQPETLPAERRLPFSPRSIARAVAEIVRLRAALGYTLASGLIFAPFVAYLSSAQQIFQQAYDTGALFPAYFASLALAIGIALLVNGRLVMRHGMRRLCKVASTSVAAVSLAMWAGAIAFDGLPPLWLFMAWLAGVFMCVGVLYGNLTALAMAPLGHIAGVGAAVVTSLGTLVAVPLGMLIGQRFDGTMHALIGGFALFGAATHAALRFAGARMAHRALGKLRAAPPEDWLVSISRSSTPPTGAPRATPRRVSMPNLRVGGRSEPECGWVVVQRDSVPQRWRSARHPPIGGLHEQFHLLHSGYRNLRVTVNEVASRIKPPILADPR